jgi:hypothetical protein
MQVNESYRRINMWKSYLFIVFGLLVCLAGSSQATDPLIYSQCDIRVLYLFDNPELIDWPTLYHVNNDFGARIDLLNIKQSDHFALWTRELPEHQIYLHNGLIGDSLNLHLDSLFMELFRERQPDIVIVGDLPVNEIYDSAVAKLTSMNHDTTGLFRISKIYVKHNPDKVTEQPLGKVVLNTRERFDRYRERIEGEVPLIFPWFSADLIKPVGVEQYDLIERSFDPTGPEVDFTSGLETFRLTRLLGRLLSDGAIKDAFVKSSRNYEAFINLALNTSGGRRVQHALTANKELSELHEKCQADSRLVVLPELQMYLSDLTSRTQQAVRKEIGLKWSGKIITRDSPEGPKLKFIASLSSDGPSQVDLNGIYFEPYWDTAKVELDAVPRKITPHQSYVREFLVEVPREQLEAQQPESLRFTAEVAYGGVPFTLTSALPIWETPKLSVEFQPKFYFVPPVEQLNVDKMVSSLVWKAILTKPTYYYGRVRLQLETPRGLYAGAYQTERVLEKGKTSETIRIPFSVSNLFELGVQKQVISLYLNDQVIAADTGLIRVAVCHVEDTVHIGFLSDSTGLLEDVLRMSKADFQPLTDRSLLTADLDAFNVIVIGSGAFRDYPNLRQMKDRLEDYVRHGGSVVIFGQPTDWPIGILPIDLAPRAERIFGKDILNRIPTASLLSKPYKISDRILFEQLEKKGDVASAIVSPGENVYVTPSGATLLSVSRIENGQIIYCGLPLLEWISKLNIEAIHLFANLLNY